MKGYVLGKIGSGATSGALLPTATAPRIMFNLLSAALAVSNVEEEEGEKEIALMAPSRRKKRGKLRRVLRRVAPIGLKKAPPHDWINAWMQFLLYLPRTLELFSFLPRSFDPFREFRDQYLADAYEKEGISSANGSYLVRSLFKVLPSYLFKNGSQVDPYEVLKCFMEAAFPIEKVGGGLSSVLFHLERHVIWDFNDKASLDKALAEKILSAPQEILVSLKNKPSSQVIKKQIFHTASFSCYELDAFIESRPDVKRGVSYIAYVKVDGLWYQCDDERVTTLLSTHLHVPLQNGVLLHYQKVVF